VKCSWCQDLEPDAICKSCCSPVHSEVFSSMILSEAHPGLVGHTKCSSEHTGRDGHKAPWCNICLCMVCGEPADPIKDIMVRCTPCGARIHRPGNLHDQKSCSVTPADKVTQCGPCRAQHLLTEDAQNYQEFVDTHHDTFKIKLNYSSTSPVDYKTVPINKPRYPHHATFYFLSPSPPTSPTSMTR
jgi:hypothetical protein